MRTLVLLGLASACAILTVGCAEEHVDPAMGSEENPAVQVGIVFDSGGRGDKSFNDATWAGAERARKELGVVIRDVDSRKESDYEKNLGNLAERGYDLVIATGLNQESALAAVAPKYPDVMFAIVDGFVDAPNVRSLKFREEEGSFLVGFIAGRVTESGKIGFVGGMSMDLIHKFEVGYFAGAKYANPDVELLPAKYAGSWSDVAMGKQAAKTLFDSGADIVYHAAGRTGLGVITAAKETGNYAIGVDMDQDWVEPGSVLTSMVKRIDEAVFATVEDVIEGGFTPGVMMYGLAEDGVGPTEFEYTRDAIGEEAILDMEAAREMIIAGEIDVPATREELETFLESLN